VSVPSTRPSAESRSGRTRRPPCPRVCRDIRFTFVMLEEWLQRHRPRPCGGTKKPVHLVESLLWLGQTRVAKLGDKWG
jgi:hypothetical protein